jgi:ketosteroid isomerase-like protein
MSTDAIARATDLAATALRYYELVDRDDVPGLVDLFAPDATYHRPGYEPMVGHDGLNAFYRGQRVIKSGKHTVHTTVTEGGNVAVSGEFHGVLRDGNPVDLRFADFFSVGPDGRFTRRDTFFFAPLA